MSANKKDINDRLMWLDGKILPVNKAYINVMSPTSQFGANVFEGIRCYWNEEKQQLFCFRMEDHYKRLLQSVRLFGLKSPYTAKDFEKYMKDVIKAVEDAGFRNKVRIMIGGAPVTQEFSDEIHADGYSDNANSAVALAKKLVGA